MVSKPVKKNPRAKLVNEIEVTSLPKHSLANLYLFAFVVEIEYPHDGWRVQSGWRTIDEAKTHARYLKRKYPNNRIRILWPE